LNLLRPCPLCLRKGQTAAFLTRIGRFGAICARLARKIPLFAGIFCADQRRHKSPNPKPPCTLAHNPHARGARCRDSRSSSASKRISPDALRTSRAALPCRPSRRAAGRGPVCDHELNLGVHPLQRAKEVATLPGPRRSSETRSGSPRNSIHYPRRPPWSPCQP